ncbi:hypothetical protein, conserved [Trypanosoma cruzi]|uniref:Uncharacterized protein n=1 Tax=Trypanosoma cruzi (strain CL Brener) TaxID=353153 RepID=Q4DTH8_TRYCC|nr:hypothetical protein, conserved [Trypanosoma cruzi]EAN95820.1 hypothetical protein, conserved [Trypanosoma cruzi]|eukprot:XP_817671.1 hypothetical protein [Trypanosoma cruzi strain CL Brener]
MMTMRTLHETRFGRCRFFFFFVMFSFLFLFFLSFCFLSLFPHFLPLCLFLCVCLHCRRLMFIWFDLIFFPRPSTPFFFFFFGRDDTIRVVLSRPAMCSQLLLPPPS